MSTVTDEGTSAVKDRPKPDLEPVVVPEAEIAQAPAPSQREKLVVSFWWAVGSLGLMVVGAFGPWVTVLGTTINGTDDSKDGWLVLSAAVLAALLLVGYALRRHAWFTIVAMLIGLVSAAIAGYDIADTNNMASQVPAGLVSTEWGIYLSLVASISLALATLAVLLQTRRKRHTTDTTQPPTNPASA
jgi:hypothetical protein